MNIAELTKQHDELSKMATPQINYMAAKALAETADQAVNEYETEFLKKHGLSETFCYEIEDDETYAKMLSALDEDAEYTRLFQEFRAAEDALYTAEDELIKWSFKSVPKSIAETLLPHIHEFKTRAKLIDLAFKLDATTLKVNV